ncbi:MAG: hypothetical protein Fur003_0130 [Candidatus Dojkabacteria bacterium]
MSSQEYLLQVRSLLKLPPEQVQDILDELESHLYMLDFDGGDYIKELGKPELYAGEINKFKSPSFMDFLKQKSTIWLSIQYYFVYLVIILVSTWAAFAIVPPISDAIMCRGLNSNDLVIDNNQANIGIPASEEVAATEEPLPDGSVVVTQVCNKDTYSTFFSWGFASLLFIALFTLFTEFKAKRGHYPQIITASIIAGALITISLILYILLNTTTIPALLIVPVLLITVPIIYAIIYKLILTKINSEIK